MVPYVDFEFSIGGNRHIYAYSCFTVSDRSNYVALSRSIIFLIFIISNFGSFCLCRYRDAFLHIFVIENTIGFSGYVCLPALFHLANWILLFLAASPSCGVYISYSLWLLFVWFRAAVVTVCVTVFHLSVSVPCLRFRWSRDCKFVSISSQYAVLSRVFQLILGKAADVVSVYVGLVSLQ